MATYTANYGLHQWVPGDNFLRTDFNTDFQKIDAGIKAAKATADVKAEIVTGTYTGDGTQNRLINLGFQPRAVLVEDQRGARNSSGSLLGGLAVPGGPVFVLNATSGQLNAVEITAKGFYISKYSNILSTNGDSWGYRYLAVK